MFVRFGHVSRRSKCPTVEFTRPRGSGNVELQKHLEKHAIVARVQRFVVSPQIVTRYCFFSLNGTSKRGKSQRATEVPGTSRASCTSGKSCAGLSFFSKK